MRYGFPAIAINGALSRRIRVGAGSATSRDIFGAAARLSTALGVIAAITYIVAVNFMVLEADSIRRSKSLLRERESERDRLQALVLKLESPGGLAAASDAAGMVENGTVRYLAGDRAVAYSR